MCWRGGLKDNSKTVTKHCVWGVTRTHTHKHIACVLCRWAVLRLVQSLLTAVLSSPRNRDRDQAETAMEPPSPRLGSTGGSTVWQWFRPLRPDQLGEQHGCISECVWVRLFTFNAIFVAFYHDLRKKLYLNLYNFLFLFFCLLQISALIWWTWWWWWWW